MPHTLPLDLASFPAVRTRKALLVLDLQNAFLAPDAALPVSAPDGYLDRTLQVAKAFRDSGSGDVVWIRTQFTARRPAADSQIVTSASASARQHVARGRRRLSEPPSEDLDADPEAFLSADPAPKDEQPQTQPQKHHSLLPGSHGSELAPSVASSVDARQDLVIAKSHYSAFESTQLLMRLRARFVTELYICGALTNISIYATALDAARHGLTLTIIQDCCGYRDVSRHSSAIDSLVQLTGCDTVSAAHVLDGLTAQASDAPPAGNDFATAIAAITAASKGPPRARRAVPQQAAAGGPVAVGGSSGAAARGRSGGGGGSALPVRTKNPERSDLDKQSDVCTQPSSSPSSRENSALSRSSTAKTALNTEPATPEPPVQPVVENEKRPAPSSTAKPTGAAAEAASEPLEVDTGEITPDEDGAEDGGPDDSSGVALASRYQKLLEQSRLRSTRGAGLLKKRLEQAAKESASARGEDQRAEKPVPKTAAPSADTPPRRPSETMAPKEDPESGGDGSDSEAKSSSDTEQGPVPVDTTKEPSATAPICAGDTIIYHDVLPPSVEAGIYERLRDEVQWLRMSHQGGEVPRLVGVQGSVGPDGDMPVYRHPADESPPLEAFTPTVVQIKEAIEQIVGHPLNHALIQLYRTGTDYISEHSDKTLDIVPGSYVCNMSLGAERTMVFRTKRVDKDPARPAEPLRSGGDAAAAAPAAEPRKRESVRVQLPHNSLCRMGLQTNMKWLHAIRQDKRASRDKTAAELAYGGGRISLTFRQIGTFLNKDQTRIWGQGAVGKDREHARDVVNGQSDEAIRMLQAFGTENHSASFDWDKHYGTGFDVLHMSSAPRFFASSDAVVNTTVQLFLADLDIKYARGSLAAPADKGRAASCPAGEPPSSLAVPVRLVDNDRDRSVVQGVLAILLYLDAVYGSLSKGRPAQHYRETAQKYTRLQQALVFQDTWRAASKPGDVLADSGAAESGAESGAAAPPQPAPSLKPLQTELKLWDSYADPAGEPSQNGTRFMAGGRAPSVVDFALWPVLHSMAAALGSAAAFTAELQRLGAGNLALYYEAFKARDCVAKVLAAGDKP